MLQNKIKKKLLGVESYNCLYRSNLKYDFFATFWNFILLAELNSSSQNKEIVCTQPNFLYQLNSRVILDILRKGAWSVQAD